jgi:YHS domain-containing protein
MENKCECPVCEMAVDIEKAPFKYEYKGRPYVFCSPKCQREFTAEPEEYCRRFSGKFPG